MPKFETQETPIEGVVILSPEVEGESREYIFDMDLLAEVLKDSSDVEVEFTEHTSEKLARGVIRGLYFQRKNSRGTLVTVESGRALAVCVDMRPESITFGASHSVELTTENERMIYIPPYFAHGFLTLEPHTTVIRNFTNESDPATESTIIWDDEILAINWQFERFEIDEKRLNILQKDKKAPSFRSYNQNTLWINRPKKSKYSMSY